MSSLSPDARDGGMMTADGVAVADEEETGAVGDEAEEAQ